MIRKMLPWAAVLLVVLLAAIATASDGLPAVNAKRQAMGLYPLARDAELQHWAQIKANQQAKNWRMGHAFRGNSPTRSGTGGNAWPGRREGAGVWSQQRGGRWTEDHNGRWFHACNMATGHSSRKWGNYRNAGAAVAVARGPGGKIKNFYCLILR